MQKEINLEEILNKSLDDNKWYLNNRDKIIVKNTMKEAIKQALELAAENAETSDTLTNCFGEPTIDKQSITDTIKQVK